MFVQLEAPGKDEINFDLTSAPPSEFMRDPAGEMAQRRKDYPELGEDSIRIGAPIVGKSGALLHQWVFRALGIKREDLFVDNTLRCLPPKLKSGQYPTGDERKKAEMCCRHYDRIEKFRPDIAVVTMHPAGILREITPLPLLVKDFEKARDFAASGLRPMVLVGGKAAKAFLHWSEHAENVTKIRGTYVWLPPSWAQDYRNLFQFTRKERKAKTPKAPKEPNLIGDLLGVKPLTSKRKKAHRKSGLEVAA